MKERLSEASAAKERLSEVSAAKERLPEASAAKERLPEATVAAYPADLWRMMKKGGQEEVWCLASLVRRPHSSRTEKKPIHLQSWCLQVGKSQNIYIFFLILLVCSLF
jgi:hypothetical protein